MCRTRGGLLGAASAVRYLTGPRWPYGTAVVLGAAAVVEALASGYDAVKLPLGLLLALAGTVPVVLAVVRPAPASAVIGCALVGIVIATGRPYAAGTVALGICLYRSARYGPPVLALVTVAGLLGYAALGPGGSRPVRVALVLAVASAVAGIAWRARADEVRQRAHSRALNDSLVAHAARGERARIARELHDVVAHHISMIAVQAEAARLTVVDMPTEGQRRLRSIADAARTALTEMRRLLGVLREDAGPAAAPDAPATVPGDLTAPPPSPVRHPQPGLAQLNDLVDEARAHAGAGVRLIVRGTVTGVDPGVELTVYRIVQEALTNARRHAPGAAVDVELEYGPDALRVRVRDNGPGPAQPGTAPDRHGLTGMRERAATVGGRLAVGPAPYGGFVVDAVLPVPREPM